MPVTVHINPPATSQPSRPEPNPSVLVATAIAWQVQTSGSLACTDSGGISVAEFAAGAWLYAEKALTPDPAKGGT